MGKRFSRSRIWPIDFASWRDPSNSRLIIAGYGATDNDNEQAMQADLRRIAESAGAGFGFASIEVVIAYDVKDEEGEKRAAGFRRQLADATASAGSAPAPAPVVVRFHFGPRFDSMMSFDAQLKRQLPPGVRFIQNKGADDATARNLTIWLAHAANRSQQLAREDFGIIVLSHGSDFIWNQSVREAVEPLTKDYKVEFAFSMADQAMIERAVRKLEQRGAKAAVIVRLFALADSFRRPVERMTGADIEGAIAAGLARAGNEHGHGGHGHDVSAGPAPRIRSTLPIETVGGLGSSPLLPRRCLTVRARCPGTQHGKRLLWSRMVRVTTALTSNGKRIWKPSRNTAQDGGGEFLAICTATWRED